MIFAVPAGYGPGTYFAIPAQHHYDEVYSPLRQYGQYSDTHTNKQTGRGRFRSPTELTSRILTCSELKGQWRCLF